MQGIEHLCQNQNNTDARTMADYQLHAPSAQHPRMPKHQVCHDGPTVGFLLRKTTNPPIHTRLLYTPCIVASLKACAQLASVLQFIQHQHALWQSHKTWLKEVSMPPRPPMGARAYASAHYNRNQHTTVVAMCTLIVFGNLGNRQGTASQQQLPTSLSKLLHRQTLSS